MSHDPQQWMASQGEPYAPAILPRRKHNTQYACYWSAVDRLGEEGEAAEFVLFISYCEGIN